MRTVNSARNPKWSDPTGYRIDLEVDFDELDEVYVPYTSVKQTPETPDYQYSHDLFQRAVDGEFGEVQPFEGFDNKTTQEAIDELRLQRNEKLKETDYIETPSVWNSLTAEKQQEWANYRQALRDLPANNPSPRLVPDLEVTGPDFRVGWDLDVTFPEKPV